MYGVRVSLKFGDTVLFPNDVPEIIRSLGLRMKDIRVGKYSMEYDPQTGVKVYYLNSRRTILAFESNDALILFNNNVYATWHFGYYGPAFYNLSGHMSVVATYLRRYKHKLLVVENESCIPEIPWFYSKKVCLKRFVTECYHAVIDQYRRPCLFNKELTYTYSDGSIHSTHSYVLRPNTLKRDAYYKTPLNGAAIVISLLLRSLAVVSELDIVNLKELEEELYYIKFVELHTLFYALASKSLAEELLRSLGARTHSVSYFKEELKTL